MAFFDTLKISGSGMTAQRLRMDVISQNLANSKTTRGIDGKPYRRQTVLMQEMGNTPAFKMTFQEHLNQHKKQNGVKVTKIVRDKAPLTKVYEPSHPDADSEGYVNYPNVNVVEEMTNLISAQRSYEANITAFNASKAMIAKSLEIGQ